MNLLSLKEAKAIAYRQVSSGFPNENQLIIKEERTLDFEWGFVFYYSKQNEMEVKTYVHPSSLEQSILVDKIDRTARPIGRTGMVLDAELEQYRHQKGYRPSIKFPIKEDISQLPLLEQVRKRFLTGELTQIRQGLQQLKSSAIVDLNQLKRIIFNGNFTHRSIEEQIAAQFAYPSLTLSSGIGSYFPNDLRLFQDSTTLHLKGAQFERITDTLLQLPKLEKIAIWYSEIKEITPRIVDLQQLIEIEVLQCILGIQARSLLEELSYHRSVYISEIGKL
ncbi:MAG: hypothetical protein AAFP19_08565 [Bacteroidota bacterium]